MPSSVWFGQKVSANKNGRIFEFDVFSTVKVHPKCKKCLGVSNANTRIAFLFSDALHSIYSSLKGHLLPPISLTVLNWRTTLARALAIHQAPKLSCRFCHIDATLGQGQWPRVTVKTGRNYTIIMHPLRPRTFSCYMKGVNVAFWWNLFINKMDFHLQCHLFKAV